MKRIIMILLTALLLLMAGCDDRQQVGVCFRDCDDPVTQQYRQDLEQALMDAGYAVTVMDAGNDQSKQDRQVAELIKDKVDALILEPVMISALDSIAQQTQEKALPVVFVNREPEVAWENACYVGCDADQPGILQARMALEGDLNGDGILSYAYISGPEFHLDAGLRSDGCAQELSYAGVQAECLALEHTDWTREKGKLRCAAVLAQYGKDVEVIFCASEELALGAIEAIKDGGRTVGENVYLYGIGGQRQSLMLIRSGDLSGTVSEDIPAQTDRVLQTMQALLAGQPPEEKGYVNYIAIDQTNVEDYIAD